MDEHHDILTLMGLHPTEADGSFARARPRVDNTHDVVSGAVASAHPDGPIYVDRRIPALSPKVRTASGEPAPLHDLLAEHEDSERRGMREAIARFARAHRRAPSEDELRTIYDTVHTRVATPAERARAHALGVPWDAYTREIDGYLDATEHERPANPPPGPLHVSPELAIGHHRGKGARTRAE